MTRFVIRVLINLAGLTGLIYLTSYLFRTSIPQLGLLGGVLIVIWGLNIIEQHKNNKFKIK